MKEEKEAREKEKELRSHPKSGVSVDTLSSSDLVSAENQVKVQLTKKKKRGITERFNDKLEEDEAIQKVK